MKTRVLILFLLSFYGQCISRPQQRYGSGCGYSCQQSVLNRFLDYGDLFPTDSSPDITVETKPLHREKDAIFTFNEIFSKEDQDIFAQLENEVEEFEAQLGIFPYRGGTGTTVFHRASTGVRPQHTAGNDHATQQADGYDTDYADSDFELVPAISSDTDNTQQVSATVDNTGDTVNYLPKVFQWDYKTTKAPPVVRGRKNNVPRTQTSGGGGGVRFLPKTFQWDYKTSTTEAPTQRRQYETRPPQTSKTARPVESITTKTPRRSTSKTTPRRTTAEPITTTTSSVVSRVPKIYDTNPKIDPFTESPSLTTPVRGTPSSQEYSPTKRPSFKIKIKLPKKPEENNRVRKTTGDNNTDETGVIPHSTTTATPVTSSQFISGNSVPGERPKLKVTDLLSDNPEWKNGAGNHNQTTNKDEFKVFAAVPAV